jgi:hypothetical protein
MASKREPSGAVSFGGMQLVTERYIPQSFTLYIIIFLSSDVS